MQRLDPHRLALRRTGATGTQDDARDCKSLDGPPSFEKIAGEIGFILLVALGLPVAMAVLVRLAAWL